MTDAEYEAEKARVWRIVTRWVRPLGLGAWDITYEWNRGLREDLPAARADCESIWHYSTARIRFFLPRCAAVDDKELENSVVHELMHCHLSGVESKDESSEKSALLEHAVSSLASAVIWVRDFTAEGQMPHAQADDYEFQLSLLK